MDPEIHLKRNSDGVTIDRLKRSRFLSLRRVVKKIHDRFPKGPILKIIAIWILPVVGTILSLLLYSLYTEPFFPLFVFFIWPIYLIWGGTLISIIWAIILTRATIKERDIAQQKQEIPLVR